MILGLLQETYPGERRVALAPAAVSAIQKLGATLLVEPGAGIAAGFANEAYTAAGAELAADREDVLRRAHVLLQVRIAAANHSSADRDLAHLHKGQLLVGGCDALLRTPALVPWVKSQATLLALELIPRITRAQSMDILSSMATVAGYRAAILAAEESPRMFPLLMTAAGTLKPARVFVIGAGVAGLQALATARRLGAVVQACDVRAATKEQVESLGGVFFTLPGGNAETKGGYAKEASQDVLKQQQEALKPVLAESDVVICTAAVPGKPAPRLIPADTVAAMKPGAVIVDLGAESGGNCELIRPGERVNAGGVKILAPQNIASEAPRAASEMFSNNVVAFLKVLLNKGEVSLKDECVAGTLVCRNGEVVHPGVRTLLGDALPAPPPPPAAAPAESAASEPPPDSGYRLAGS